MLRVRWAAWEKYERRRQFKVFCLTFIPVWVVCFIVCKLVLCGHLVIAWK
jgi:hypothetical protein